MVKPSTLVASALLTLALVGDTSNAFAPTTLQDFHNSAPSSTTTTTTLFSTRAETSAMMREMRTLMVNTDNENDDANLIMQALRGQNLNDDDQAAVGLEMQLVDVQLQDGESGLPYQYDPQALRQFFSKRPLTVLTRILQVAAVGGGFFVRTALDTLLKRLDNNPELEVQRAGELRDLMTSLGPFFVRL